jgi:hypothetical protein
MEILPDEILVKILEYIYQDPDENYSLIYISKLACLNLVSKKFNFILTNYWNFIIGKRDFVNDYVPLEKKNIIHILNGFFVYIPDKYLKIKRFINYKKNIINFINRLMTQQKN